MSCDTYIGKNLTAWLEAKKKRTRGEKKRYENG